MLIELVLLKGCVEGRLDWRHVDRQYLPLIPKDTKNDPVPLDPKNWAQILGFFEKKKHSPVKVLLTIIIPYRLGVSLWTMTCILSLIILSFFLILVMCSSLTSMPYSFDFHHSVTPLSSFDCQLHMYLVSSANHTAALTTRSCYTLCFSSTPTPDHQREIRLPLPLWECIASSPLHVTKSEVWQRSAFNDTHTDHRHFDLSANDN